MKTEMKLTEDMKGFIRDDARGVPTDELIRRWMHVDPSTFTDKEKNKYAQRVFRWRHHSQYDAIWNDEIRQLLKRNVPASLSRIGKQVDSDTEWLANKAANDTLTWASKVGVIKTEETAMKVEITGMPDLGSPDDSDA